MFNRKQMEIDKLTELVSRLKAQRSLARHMQHEYKQEINRLSQKLNEHRLSQNLNEQDRNNQKKEDVTLDSVMQTALETLQYTLKRKQGEKALHIASVCRELDAIQRQKQGE